MASVKIKDGIHFVGAFNPNLRVFDIIMTTDYGTTYSAYLVQGSKKTALIETVHDRFTEEYFENIQSVCNIADIDYIILNHTEPDHSGSLVALLEKNPKIQVIASAGGLKNLKAITNGDFNAITAKDGDTVDLGGGKVLKFIIAPNLHWPDSMFTYLESDKTLFSCDFLGCHYCETRVFDSKIAYADKYDDAFKYYYDAIFGPFKPFVLAGLDKIKDLDIDTVCPSHGPVLQDRTEDAMALYRQWSTPKDKSIQKKVSIFYVSAYGYTKMMAECLVDGLTKQGVNAKGYDVLYNDISCLKEILEESDGVMFGSPTINRDALKPIWDLLSMTDAIINKGKPCFVFGSYGWSGEAVGMLNERLKGLKLNVMGEGYKVCFMPNEDDCAKLSDYAVEFVRMLG